MRRNSRSKSRKVNENKQPAVPVQEDDEEIASNNSEASSSIEKSNSRSRGKAKPAKRNLEQSKNENDHENEEDGKPARKKMKDEDDDYSSHDSDQSDNEIEEPKKKQKSKDKNSTNKGKKVQQNGSPSKGKKKGKIVSKKNIEETKNSEEYEVEKIVSQRSIKGRRQFLVRWKGYGSESDTWEQEKDLNCDYLIKDFLDEQGDNKDDDQDDEERKIEKTEKATKTARGSKKQSMHVKVKANSSKEKKKEEEDDDEDADSDESKEFEVERIIDVHFKKDKKREFLIRWKGFTSAEDTWEPEEHVSCPHLIEKFMEKLEKIKNQDSRELRTNPTHTKRYTLSMHAEKRLSRRNLDKERKTYFECDN